jgi:flagellar motor switch protein FliM
MQRESSVLRRIARPPAPPSALTSARALRLAFSRAAQQAVALPLSIIDVSEEEGALDDLLSRLEEGLLLLSLQDDGSPSGFIALDADARAAVVEMQTIGRVSNTSPEPRSPTSADAALARPLIQAFLTEAQEAMEGTALDGWLRCPTPAQRLNGPRDVAMLLPDGRYRIVRLTIDLGAGARRGLVVLLHRLAPPVPELGSEGLPEITVAPQVLDARVTVSAILHRLQLPLAEAEALAPGQVLPLPGVTVASVQLRAGGCDLGPARLGQMAGRRAVRLEQPVPPQLTGLSGGLADPMPPRLPAD